MPGPTRRFAAALAALAVVAAVLPLDPWPSVAVVTALAVVAGAVDAALGVDPRRLPVTREAPAVLALGGHGQVRWTVRNPSGRRLAVALADELGPGLGAAARRVRLDVPAGGVARASVDLRPNRRGRHDVGELVVRTAGPLGLAARQARRELPATVRVPPPFRARDEAELRVRRARLLEVGLRSARGRGGGTEFDHLRDHTPDDEFRRIDWAATARAGRLIVREHRAERNQRVVVLVDAGRTMAATVDGAPLLDHAMDAALALTAVATRLGDRVGLVAFDREVRAVVPAGHAGNQLGRIVEGLYELEPQLWESDYRGAFAETLARTSRRALLVLLTDLLESSVTESLVPALPLVARRHAVLVAGARDPVVDAWAHQPAGDAAEVYRRAAAATVLADRRRAAATLGGLGALVVDELPARLPGALVDAYLEVKAIGRL